MAGGGIAALAAGLLAGVALDDPGESNIVLWTVVACQNLGHIGALVWITRYRGHGSLADALGFSVEPRHAWWILVGAASTFPLGFLAGVLRQALGIDTTAPQAIVEAVAEVSGPGSAAVVVSGVVILGPIAEELLYRGLTLATALQSGRSPSAAIAISSAVFALAHLADPALFSAAGAVTLAVLFLVGLLLGVLRVRSGTLGAPIFAHSGFNLMTLAILFASA